MTASFLATYSDWKPIKTRRVIQIIFEVPWEGEKEAYRALDGMPDPGGSDWYSITKHDPNAGDAPARVSPDREAASTQTAPQAPASRLTKQAGMACNDPVFRKFLKYHAMLIDDIPECAAIAVRLICDVKSRKEFIPSTPAGSRWEILYGQFLAWREAA